MTIEHMGGLPVYSNGCPGNGARFLGDEEAAAVIEGYGELGRLAGVLVRRVARTIAEPWIGDGTAESAKAVDEMAVSMGMVNQRIY